jgi:hypothetical protein
MMLFPEGNLLAQKWLFTVIASSGRILYSSKSLSQWTDLTTGNKLFPGDSIKLEVDSYLGLCYQNGRTMEVTKPGTYSVDNLAKKLISENSSVTKRMTDYLINEMLVKNRTKEMKNIAGVVRQNLTYIDKDFPASAVLVDSLVTFKWFPVKEVNTYILEIQNPERKTIVLEQTKDTSIQLNIEQLNFEPDNCYVWFVFSAEDSSVCSDTSCIKVITKSRYKEMQDSLKDILSDLSDSYDSPLNQMILATFFENNNMSLKALEHYQKAIQYSGQVEEYQKKYLLFLTKVGLYRRAQIMMQKWNIY